MNTSRHRIAVFSLLAATFIWGGTFIIAKDVLDRNDPTALSPFRYIAIRFSAAALLMAAIWGGKLRALSRQTIRHGCVLGAFVGGGYILQAIGLESGSPSRAAFITGLSVLFVPIIGGALGITRVTQSSLLGLSVAFSGFCLLSWPENQAEGFRFGDFATLGCAIFFAFHILFTERFAHASNSTALNILQLGIAAGIAGIGCGVVNLLHLCGFASPSVFLAETQPITLTLKQGFQLAYLIIFATIICYQLQTRSQKTISSAQTALILMLEPVFATTFAFLIIGENIGVRSLIGGALTVIGVLISELYRPSTMPGRRRECAKSTSAQ